MMDTATRITQLEARLEVLQNMQFNGVLRVKHGDVETWFRTMNELDQAIAALQGELRRLRGTNRRPGYVRER